MAKGVPYAAVPRALVGDRRVTDRGVRLYAVLTRFTDRHSLAWPSQRTLAEQMECSIPTVERAVRELRDAGWVTVTRRGPGGPNVYRVNTKPDPDAAARIEAASRPPAHSRALTPPITDDGTLPSHVRGHYIDKKENEKNLASRGATLDEDVDEMAGSEFDPEFIAGFQDGRENKPAAKTTGARALAMELRSAWMQHGPNPVAGDINVAAVAGQIAAWRRTGVTVDEIRGMITLFVSARGFHIPGAPPWKAFLTRRLALLQAVRTTREAVAAETDPGYWSPARADDAAEADAWYRAQFAGSPGA
jgi:biotin operon repressor